MTSFQLASAVGVGGTVLLSAAHWLVVRPRRGAPPAAAPRTVLRYNLWERLVHAVTAAGFLVLFATGFYPTLVGAALADFDWLLMTHTAASAAFFVGLLAMGLTWAEDCRFRRNDLRAATGRSPLMKATAGFRPPLEGTSAARFDLVQKAYFWLALGLGLSLLASTMLAMVPLFGQAGQAWLYEIHRWGALVLVMATIAHTYRQTVAKPGTWRALLDGRVSRDWAARHHPLWGER